MILHFSSYTLTVNTLQSTPDRLQGYVVNVTQRTTFYKFTLNVNLHALKYGTANIF
jgi:hypothetical protein